MKVAFVYPHIEGDGGYPRDLRALRTALQAAGHSVVTALPQDPGRIRGRAGWDEAVLAAPLMRALRTVDIVHFFGFFFPLYPLLARTVSVSGRPYVVSPMGQLETHARVQSAGRKRLFLALGGRSMLRRAAAVHVFSGAERRSIEQLEAGLRYDEAPLGLHESDLPSPLPPPADGGSDRPFFLCFGRLSVHHKGLDLLLDDFARYVREGGAWNLRIAGRDWHGSHAWIRARIQTLGLQTRARLIGEVDDTTKWALMAGSAAVVYPTRHDGPPRPLRDALLARHPILASRQSNLLSDIESHGWGCSFEAEPTAIAAALHRFERAWTRTPPPYRDPMQVLSWGAVATQYIGMYRRALAGGLDTAAAAQADHPVDQAWP